MKKYITKILAVLLIISTVSINAANTTVGATNVPDAASQGAASVAGQDDAWPKRTVRENQFPQRRRLLWNLIPEQYYIKRI